MPANLPPQYQKAEDEFRALANPGERLEKLREMYRLLPKHKGTEKLQSDLKQKMSRLKDEIEGAGPGAKKGGVEPSRAARGGGPDRAGRAAERGQERDPGGADQRPARGRRLSVHDPGAAARDHDWEDVAVQLVDLPPISPDFLEPWVPGMVRSADAALLVADLASDDVAEGLEAVLERLAAERIELVGELPFDVEDEAIRHVKTRPGRRTRPTRRGPTTGWRSSASGSDRGFPCCRSRSTAGEGLETLREAAYHS